MNKIKLILMIGIWVAILPYLGFPLIFKNILFSLTGMFLIYLAYVLKRKSKTDKHIKHKKPDSFSENNHFSKNERAEDQLINNI